MNPRNAIPAIAYASVARGYPPALRSRVFAIFSTAWVVPGLIGPAMSSAIAGALGWRAVFLALLPIVAVVLGAIVLTEPISWNLFAGTAIVLAGVAVSDKRFARPSTRSKL